MHLWLVLVSVLITSPQWTAPPVDAQTEPLRYRGIEQLLAKFEAEADAD